MVFKVYLDLPLNEVLNSGKPDFPFCLCWANEKWTRAWEAHEKGVLIRQEYSESDRIEHINWLCNVFKDNRYILVDGKPLLLIYRIDEITDLKERISDWRKIAKNHGFSDLYICFVRNYENIAIEKILDFGFDAMAEHQPEERSLPRRSFYSLFLLSISRILNKIIKLLSIESYFRLVNENRIFSYSKMVKKSILSPHPKNFKKFPSVFPSWDNSARKRIATIIQNDDEEIYSKWLEAACTKVDKYSESEQIVFINAWNEWAEGCHLEPDLRNGKKFLEATAKIADKFSIKN